MQVRLAHLKDLIVFFQKVVWFIGFWDTILQILLTEISKNGWLSKNSRNYFNFGVDVWYLFLFFPAAVFFYSKDFFFLSRAFFFRRDLFLFHCEHFSFTTGISLLPQAFFFCCDLLFFLPRVFSFCCKIFPLALIFSFLPQAFSFAASIFALSLNEKR